MPADLQTDQTEQPQNSQHSQHSEVEQVRRSARRNLGAMLMSGGVTMFSIIILMTQTAFTLANAPIAALALAAGGAAYGFYKRSDRKEDRLQELIKEQSLEQDQSAAREIEARSPEIHWGDEVEAAQTTQADQAEQERAIG